MLKLPAKATTFQAFSRKLPNIIETLQLIRFIPVSLQEPSEDPHSGNPHTLLAGPGILGTLPLTKPTVTTLATGFIISADTGPRVNSDRLLDDKTILNQLPDVLPGVGIGDLIDLIGVKPDLYQKQGLNTK